MTPLELVMVFILLIAASILFVCLLIIWRQFSRLKSTFSSEVSRRVAEVKAQAAEAASRALEEWKRRELQNTLRAELEGIKRGIGEVAVGKSILAPTGEPSEQIIAPLYMAKDLGIDLRDLRFIGTPIPYIAFKGLSNGKLEEILFINVKPAEEPLANQEKLVKDAVERGNTHWVTYYLGEEFEEALGELEHGESPAQAEAKKPTPIAEKTIEVKTPQEEEVLENKSFWEWIEKEFGIKPDEFLELDEDVKKWLTQEFLKELEKLKIT